MTDSPGFQRVTELFRQAFGTDPTVVASAPGRVNLIGEHLDYNGGPVLPFAVDRRTWIACASAAEFAVVSAEIGGVPVIRREGCSAGDWSDYLVGVMTELRRADQAPAGARVAVASEVERGAGLSSSAALTVAAAAALTRLAGHEAAPDMLVDTAFRAEHDFVGVRCGRMDQTIAVHGIEGTATLYETASGARTAVPFHHDVWILPTGVAHTLADGGYNARRRECEEALRRCRTRLPGLSSLAGLNLEELDDVIRYLEPPLERRVRHVVSEVGRTREAARVLLAGDMPALGRLLVDGHESLRTDFESTVPEADLLVEAAVSAGAYGARLTGAGWGGSVIMLAPPAEGAEIAAAVDDAFAKVHGRAPRAWTTRPSGGVRVDRAA